MRGRIVLLGLFLAVAQSGSAELSPPDALDLDAAPRTHVTASGVEIELPDLEGLTCLEMRAVLRKLDLSGYRGRGLLGEGHPDYPLFAYEDRLASQLYIDCVLRESREARQRGLFGGRFGGDD